MQIVIITNKHTITEDIFNENASLFNFLEKYT